MTVNGNQGLEALAALCGGQSDAPTESGAQGNSRKNGSIAAPQAGAAGSAPVAAPTPTPTQMQHMFQAALHSAHSIGPAHHQSTMQGFTQQQWQQALAATAALQGGGNLESVARNLLVSAVGAHNPQPQPQPHDKQPPTQQQQQQMPLQQQAVMGDAPALAAIQQLAYYQYLATAQQAAAGIGGSSSSSQATSLVDPRQALALALVGKTQTGGGNGTAPTPASTPVSIDNARRAAAPAPSTAGLLSTMPPPPPPQANTPATDRSQASSSSANREPPATPPSSNMMSSSGNVPAPSSVSSHMNIAPMPGESGAGKHVPRGEDSCSVDLHLNADDKKQLKRAANRRSAQLSRKRKKQFIEELKEENDELRRKEQILRSIPDLVVVFDSSGKLWFVSQSVTRFLNMTPGELEGTSFWDRLCEDSVRLLKAAFMDSLAARKSDSETAPLGSGVWELRLVDKDRTQKVVTLSGVVHFSGDAPECVCCIRPRHDYAVSLGKKSVSAKSPKQPAPAVSSSSDGSQGSSDDVAQNSPELTVKPNQSVINGTSSSSFSDQIDTNEGSDETADDENEATKNGSNKSRDTIRISDGDTGSVSDSGSGSEMCT